MGIFDFAMKMEQDGEAFYRDLAAKTDDKGLKTIMLMMADEEVKHYATFKAMNEGGASMADSEVMGNARNLFDELAERDGGTHYGDDAIEQYKKARQIEKDSEELYRQKAEEVENEELKTLLHRIADEERRHYNVLDNMIEMIERPSSWIEDAEWRNSNEF